jgi:hypothetical protein
MSENLPSEILKDLWPSVTPIPDLDDINMSENLPSEILPKDLWSSVTPIPDLDAKIFAELKSKNNVFRINILIDNYPEYKDLYSYTEESDTYLQRAYYAVVMAGEEGLALTKEHGLQRAGEIIYAASRGDGTHPNLGEREYWHPFLVNWEFNYSDTRAELRQATGAKSFFEQAKEALAKLRKPEAKDDLKASVDKPTEGTSKHLRMKWNNG